MYKIHGIEAIVVDRKRTLLFITSPIKWELIFCQFSGSSFSLSQQKKIILDFGTALTASCVAEDGEVLGVIIAPGIITSLNSLVKQTAQLPEIELTKPKSVLGHDTVSCMTSGMVYGF